MVISVGEAQAIVRAQCTRLRSQFVPVQRAIGRVLANDIRSAVELPPFDNSAMDGFALRCDGAAPAIGSEYPVRGEQVAGDGAWRAEGDGAWAIMTGARLPEGLDTVVPIEKIDVVATDADGRPSRIGLAAAVRPGQHVRRAGEDIAAGALAARSGSLICPSHLLLLAGLGIARIAVVRRPRVALLCTGRELVDDPAQPLQPGQIRNSNAPFLAARLDAAGATLAYRQTVSDDPDEFATALGRALQAGADLVLSTGAVSMGRHDYVPASLRSLGAEVLFHKLAMRPGKPLLCARLAGGQLHFGLPGNPVSSAVGMRFFVEAALRAQLGLAEEKPWRVPLAHAVQKPLGVRMFQKAALSLDPDGRLQLALLAGQESFKTLPMLDANAWAALPEDAEALAAGSMIDVFPLGHMAGIRLGDSLS